MKYHKRIRSLREDNNLSQQQLADYVEIDRVTYNRLENEKYYIKFDYAIRIAKFFNISLDYIAGLIDEPKPINDNVQIKIHKLSTKEKALIKAYKSHPELQYVIDKIFDIQGE